jgi:glycosyltransferase involved in cell wall biosynthesis
MYTPHAYYGLEGQKSTTAFFFNSLETILGPVGFTTTCSSDERTFGLETLKVPQRRLILVNHGIDVGRYHPPSPIDKKLCRSEFGFPEGVRVLVSVGRDSYQKNYPPLYQALEKVLSDPGTHFVFAHAGAGSAELGAQLSPAARKRFYSFSYVSALERLMAASDGFILTSRYEGLSLSVLISIACGLKMFLTTAPGNICLKRIGFDSIDWIDCTKDGDAMAAEIEEHLRAWDASSEFNPEHQVDLAQKCFNRDVQLEKICRIYVHLTEDDEPMVENDPGAIEKEKA